MKQMKEKKISIKDLNCAILHCQKTGRNEHQKKKSHQRAVQKQSWKKNNPKKIFPFSRIIKENK